MQNFNIRKLFSIFLFVLLVHSGHANDSLRIEKRKFISVKSNLAILIFRGFSLQAEYIAGKHTGIWAEGSHHYEEQSMLDVSLHEFNLVTGINYYGAFSKRDTCKIHNGPYIGPYIKYKEGFYQEDKTAGYRALFLGVQTGIQSVSKQNIIFTMGIGYGIGYFCERKRLAYSTFYEKYNLPVMDFRANISIGYMF